MFTEKVNELFDQQLAEWDLAKMNYGLLSKVRTRHIGFANFEVRIQFNPERIRSSAAKVDAKSIEARPCFLCKVNRPPEQQDLVFSDKYIILVNPFPVFFRHLTIPSVVHTGQRIEHSFEDMLILAESLPDFVIFYNGPQCGASAPDHLHFQAGNKGMMPLECDFNEGRIARRAGIKDGIEIFLWPGYLRGIITLRGFNIKGLSSIFGYIYRKQRKLQPDRPEPMLNILVSCDAHGWTVHIIPRKIHRPAQFFLEGDDQLLISPASVDLGGLIITPREEDFNKLDIDKLTDIFRQVCFDENETRNLIEGYL